MRQEDKIMTMADTITKNRLAAGIEPGEARWEGNEYARCWRNGTVDPETIMRVTGWTREELKRRTGK